MRPLTWQEYYTNFDSWAQKTREMYVSRLSSFGPHDQVAEIVSGIYTESVASKLANMAMDAGIRFDKNDIFLMDCSVNEETLKRMRQAENKGLAARQQKKKNREAFWTGIGQAMFIDDTIDTFFGQK